ncbi:MAG TPA: three-Cys-motif partner protein TcmP [Blastocatellia bacterium]|nr:three-Cys-motif partner protein TcmP [Blastocatellia bacterium]
MPKRLHATDDDPFLIEELPLATASPEPLIKPIDKALWTGNKAKLIERYLFYFVLVTRHGSYIDGFAGPQREAEEGSWAAKLVMESQPRWFRHFYLFEKKNDQVARLDVLKASQPERDPTRREPKRDVRIYPGDFNVNLHELLKTREIGEKEATFCLLDQRTFECQWSSVEALAQYKHGEHKIELFYFLANRWLARALANVTKDYDMVERWWGGNDWRSLRSLSQQDRARRFEERFRGELGYKSAKAWPIHRHKGGRGAIMYYMIHATDHPQAPGLMSRAYNNVGLSIGEEFKQLELNFGPDFGSPPPELLEDPTQSDDPAQSEFPK